jgi:hypothetical protein
VSIWASFLLGAFQTPAVVGHTGSPTPPPAHGMAWIIALLIALIALFTILK